MNKAALIKLLLSLPTPMSDAEYRALGEAAAAALSEAEERAHYAEGVADLAMKHRDAAEALSTLKPEGSSEFVFTSDDDATEVLKSYGHEEHRNGLIKADWNIFDERCRAAINYLCNEWDFVFEHVDTPPEPNHSDTLKPEGATAGEQCSVCGSDYEDGDEYHSHDGKVAVKYHPHDGKAGGVKC